ncbi:hypothetical protein KUCAC02_029771, partial [Chaenocephalus aceratus]
WEVSVVDGECLEQRPTESHHCALCLQNIYARQLNTSFPRHPTTNTRLFSTVKDRSLGPEIRAPSSGHTGTGRSSAEVNGFVGGKLTQVLTLSLSVAQ